LIGHSVYICYKHHRHHHHHHRHHHHHHRRRRLIVIINLLCHTFIGIGIVIVSKAAWRQYDIAMMAGIGDTVQPVEVGTTQ
jgi:hypothetical protein